MSSLLTQVWLYFSLSHQGITVFNCVEFRRTQYGDYVFPCWADGLGWMLTLTSVLCIPAVAVYKLCTTPSDGTFIQVSLTKMCLLSVLSENIVENLELNFRFLALDCNKCGWLNLSNTAVERSKWHSAIAKVHVWELYLIWWSASCENSYMSFMT